MSERGGARAKPLGYRVYLLRIWEERDERAKATPQRWSLEDPYGGQRYGFAAPERMVAFLRTLAGQADAAPQRLSEQIDLRARLSEVLADNDRLRGELDTRRAAQETLQARLLETLADIECLRAELARARSESASA